MEAPIRVLEKPPFAKKNAAMAPMNVFIIVTWFAVNGVLSKTAAIID